MKEIKTMGEFKRLNILTVYSRFFLVILGLLQNTIAEDYLEGAIDGEEYLKQIINGDRKYSIIQQASINSL